LRRLLQDEAIERGYPISDLEMLELDKELDFIPFSPSSNKFEALLNSIVTSRVIRLKLPGKSYVLGSEEGFQETRLDDLTKEKAEALGIVTTSNFKGKLRPARLAPDGKTRLPAQAIVPWKLRDQNGDIIEMEKYIIEKDGKKMLDRSKVPSEVLQMFGMRIPNQGPNSQSWIEIVGFLPEASGDLFIAVKDYVVQMGSDFDVDKLYTYQYNLYEDEGFVRVHRREDDEAERRKALQNKILDVHIAIHKNPDKTVQEQIANPLGFWKLKDDKEPEGGLANEIEILRRGKETDVAMFTGLSDDYQRRKFKNAAAGKSGVGVFSNDSMFNAIIQGKDMVYMVKDSRGKDVPLRVAFGEKVSHGDLSNPMALDGETFKSDVIAGYQSAAVDNEKEQILDKINVNNHTYKVIKILNQLGFGEEVPLFLSQDIIIDYVNELERLGSSLTGYVPNREKIARENVNKKYGIAPSPRDMMEIKYADEAATPEMMRRYIAEGASAPDYTDAQAAFLEKFIELDGYGQTIQELQSAINPDSAGIGKSVMEAQLKEDQVYRLINSPVANAERLVGEIIPIKKTDRTKYEKDGYLIREGIGRDRGLYAVKSNTVNGHAITYGLFNSNDWWGQIYEYNTPTVQAMMEKVEDVASGSNDTAIASKAKRRLEVWKELKSYIYSDNDLGLFDERSDINSERERLLYDKWEKDTQTHESLASFIRRIQQTAFGKNNPLISKLEVSVEKNGTPSQVTYRASAAENVDETDIYTAFVDLITSTDSEGNSKVIGTLNGKDYRKRDLGQDLVIYAYITGGIQEAVQFVKYIPAAYLTTIPFAQNLSDMGFVERDFGITVMEGKAEYYNTPPFVEQYIQHSPEKAVTVSPDFMTDTKVHNKIPYQFTLKKEGAIALGEETRQYGIIVPPYLSMRAGNSESGMVLYKYDFKKGIYVQIDTLGTFGVSEYNKNLKEGDSQISDIGLNRSPVSPLDRPATPAITEREDDTEPAVNKEDAKKKTGDDLMSNLAQGIAQEETIEDGFERSKSILNHIVNYGSDSYQAVLADELMKNIEKLPPELKIAISNADVTSAGRFTYSTHTMTLFQKGIKNGEHGANQTFMHELLHGLTGYKIAFYLYGEEDSKEGRGIRAAVKNIPNFKLTEKDKAAIKSIDILRKQAEQTIVNTPELQALYDDVKKRLEEKEGISKSEISQFYGLTNALEFVSVALTDPGFQRLLNNIEAPSGKTFWEALKERLVRLLNSMGFDVKEGSLLEQVVYDTLDLIQDREEFVAKPVGVTVEHQDNITRSDLKNNPDKVYLFGDNLQEKGLGGQAKAMRGEPNAIGIPTKKKPSLGEDAFFTDDEYEGNIVAIENAFAKIPDNTVVVIPSAGLGTGLARLEQKAPRTFAYLQDKLNELQPEIPPTNEIEPDKQLTLPDGKVITFSDEQYVGLEKIRKFLKTSDNFFTLSGYAGTGKTTIIKKIIDESTDSIIVSAPTHKAKDKISETTQESGITLHKLLGLKPNVQLDKFKPSDMQFQVLGDPTINEYGLVIIDEASMINKDLLEIIEALVEGSDTKVIFMGDEAQIPPVGEKASEVFVRYMKEGTSHQLVETQRLTDGNPLGPVYDKIRNNLDKPDGGMDRKTAMNQRGEGIRFTNDFQTLDDIIKEKFTAEEVADNPDYVKFIAWRNETVTAVNKHIRKHIFGEDAQDFEVGDWLMGYTTIGKTSSSVYVQNSLDYKVLDVGDITESRDGVKGREVVVEYYDIDTKRKTTQRMFLIDVTDEENFKNYISLHDKYVNAAKSAPSGRAKGQAWAAYYNFRGRNMSTAFVKRTVGDNISPDINYGYAITGHKSQGSTYKHVIVHETDINANRKMKERNQIKYVALSRPTHTATVYTNKPVEETNTVVDKPVTVPTEPAVTDDTNFKGISDNDIPTVEGSIFSNLIEATPQSIVSDEALDEYMKRCKK
jgi:exodeoxyribonuclease-5